MLFSLDAIARDDVNPGEAKVLLDEAIAGAARPAAIYAALAQWTWTTLTGRRFGDDLRGWHRVLQECAVRLEDAARAAGETSEGGASNGLRYAERIEALSDLLKASIHVSSSMRRQDVLAKAHVIDVLIVLSRYGDGTVERAAIERELGLSPANLSRVLTMMGAVDLVERHAAGRTARFAITGAGLEALTEDVEAQTSDTRARLETARSDLAELKNEVAKAEKAKARVVVKAKRLRAASTRRQMAIAALAGVGAESSETLTALLFSATVQPGHGPALGLGSVPLVECKVVRDAGTLQRQVHDLDFGPAEYDGLTEMTVKEGGRSFHEEAKFHSVNFKPQSDGFVMKSRRAFDVNARMSFGQSIKAGGKGTVTMRREG